MSVQKLLLTVCSILAAMSWCTTHPAHLLSMEPNDQVTALEALMDDVWEAKLRAYPLYATRVGRHEYNDRLGDVSASAEARRAAEAKAFLERLRAIPTAKLSLQQQIDWQILEHALTAHVDGYRFKTHLIPITNRWGFHIEFAQLADQVPLRTVQDYRNYIERLKRFREFTRQHIGVMRDGVRQGYTLPAVVLKGFDDTIAAHVVDDPTQSLLYAPFDRFPSSVPVEERERLRQDGLSAIRHSVVPGYRSFLEFFRDEYFPAARRTIGAADLPHGKAYYRYCIRLHTTLDKTPEAIHRIGLEEVARIRKEMDEVRRRAGFEGDHRAFVAFLRTDPRFYAKTPDELLQHVAWILKRADGQLPRLFRRLPRTPYGLKPIPDYIAPKTTSAYYSEAPGDGTRAGFYFLNTYDLKSRPLFEMEALSLHEAVPGHHLQIALAQELKDLHPLRRFSELNSYIEGWGLYSERLGKEMGFYTDPYSDFGRLSFEMWRACRLVVDTGMHSLGWSRQRAIDFMKEQTALSEHNIEAEVDRYISWPGQALGYKLGELKIRALRARAEDRLGERFDVREFHDVILRYGSVPLATLETIVDRYLDREEGKAGTRPRNRP